MGLKPTNKLDDFYNYTIQELNVLIKKTPAVKKIAIKYKTPDYVTYSRDEWETKAFPKLLLVTGVFKIDWNSGTGLLKIG
jgi:hypothetical protein